MHFEQTRHELILHEPPVVGWPGAFLIEASLFVTVYVVASAMIDSSSWRLSAAMLAAGVGFYFILAARYDTTTTIDRAKNTISIRQKGIIKYSFEVYSFGDVAGPAYIDETNDTRSNKTYQLMIPLKDGTKIELSGPITDGESKYFNAVQLINGYIFDSPDQIPFNFAVFVDD